jgi:hypothetical protein
MKTYSITANGILLEGTVKFVEKEQKTTIRIHSATDARNYPTRTATLLEMNVLAKENNVPMTLNLKRRN